MTSEQGFLGPQALWIGVGNPATARLVERSRPAALWVSSYCASAELKGAADMSLVSGPEMIALARRVGQAVGGTPVVLDCDSGFGDEHIWRDVVEEVARTSEVAALCIEDKRFPKRNSFYDVHQELLEIAEFARMIRTAIATRDAFRPSLRIIARTETLVAGGSIQEAATRIAAYGQAGADGFFIQARATAEELVAALALITGHGRRPVAVAPSAFPDRSPADWWAAGASVVIHANQLLRSALKAQEVALERLMSPDVAPRDLDAMLWSMRDVDALVRRPDRDARPDPIDHDAVAQPEAPVATDR